MTEDRVRAEMDFAALGQLREAAWSGRDDGNGARSLTWVTVHNRERPVGFVNVAWNGGAHAFLLEYDGASGRSAAGLRQLTGPFWLARPIIPA